MTTVASPIRFDGVDVEIKRPTPEVGEHTAEVLADLGYAQSDIEKLLSAKVIK